MFGWKILVISILFLGLFACADDSGQDKKDKSESKKILLIGNNESPEIKVGDNAVSGGEEQKTENLPPLSREEIRIADTTLTFSNRARDILNNGLYAAVHVLKDNVSQYRKTWSLPKRPKLPVKFNGDDRLKPPSGIFSKSEEKDLTLALAGMNTALNDIINHYKNLEKYISDSSIIDDGKRGLELSEKLEQSHFQYMKAQKSWLGIVEAKAAEAEAKLLREHPLERQILSAKNIFNQMREIAEIISSEPDNRQIISQLGQNLNAIIEEAGQPPFQAQPFLERLYKAFLKDANTYAQILNRGMLEGFHNVQKKELQSAQSKCGESYNEFVRAVNRMSDRV